MDIDYLLSPYVSLKETERRWNEHLEKIGRKCTSKEIEKLAMEIHKEHNVSKEALSALFNRRYHRVELDSREWPSLKKFVPPSFEGIESMEFSDTILIDEITQRLGYPRGCTPDFGPNNADKDAESLWCHDLSDSYECSVNHGMYRCTCFNEIPFDGFFCHACRTKVQWSRRDFARMPIVGDDYGGWGNFFCSKDCMMEFLNPSEMQTLIIDVVDSCTE